MAAISPISVLTLDVSQHRNANKHANTQTNNEFTADRVYSTEEHSRTLDLKINKSKSVFGREKNNFKQQKFN